MGSVLRLKLPVQTVSQGLRGIELDAFLRHAISRNDETAFRLQARSLEGNGPASLRVELDPGGSAFRPVSQPIKSGRGRWAVLTQFGGN